MVKITESSTTVNVPKITSQPHTVSRRCFNAYQGFKDFAAFVLKIITCGCYKKKTIGPNSTAHLVKGLNLLLDNFNSDNKNIFTSNIDSTRSSAFRKALKDPRHLEGLCASDKQSEIAHFIKIMCQFILETYGTINSNPLIDTKDLLELVEMEKNKEQDPVNPLREDVRADFAEVIKKLDSAVQIYLTVSGITYKNFVLGTKGSISSLLRGYGYLKDVEIVKIEFPKP